MQVQLAEAWLALVHVGHRIELLGPGGLQSVEVEVGHLVGGKHLVLLLAKAELFRIGECWGRERIVDGAEVVDWVSGGLEGTVYLVERILFEGIGQLLFGGRMDGEVKRVGVVCLGVADSGKRLLTELAIALYSEASGKAR